MTLFYQPNISTPVHTLDRDESRHCIKVLRLKAGELISLTNGKGLFCEARILEEDPHRCTVGITQSKQEESRSSGYIHMAVAPTKNISRYEWFLEKATEIGVDEITPVICDNSERKIIKTERLKKVLVAAMKQSLKPFLPILNEPMSIDRFIHNSQEQQKFIAYCSDQYRDLLKNKHQKNHHTLLLIGPEGDFSGREIELALQYEFLPVSLGKSRLRTETAGVAACHTIQLLNEDQDIPVL